MTDFCGVVHIEETEYAVSTNQRVEDTVADVARHRDENVEWAHGALKPIAIVGIGCRFPGGADSPAAFWDLLKNGVDAVTEVPPDRWTMPSFFNPDPKAPGKMYSRWGGFLDHIDRFDAQFFRIAPREATHMDPQQRLLLEVCWEALEDAGQDVSRLAGTNAGVFIGISAHDYADMQAKDVYSADAYTNTGCALSIAANRLSYVLDLRGPSVAVDTACSSSLVAVHLACRSVWAGECSVAITGGVNCLLTPESSIGFCKATMLSPTGRCRTFDAQADGYVRSEGAGVIVLKPLDDAVAARDPIYAVIVGSGVNQDGHSQGLTVPSSDAQAALLRDVYRRANIHPDRILYFEAHGTGTLVGDPLEAAAIGAALGSGRSRGNALRIGSLKTNIGHLEAAAGIAGIIKAALSIRHRVLPPTLHFRSPNPRIPLGDLGLRVQHELEIIAGGEPASVIGVNAFGFGGTNAHVALDRAPDVVTSGDYGSPQDQGRSCYVVALSARGPEALQAAAAALSRRANATGEPAALQDVCHTAGTRRTHHDHRLAVVTDSVGDLAEQLAAFARGEARPGLVSGRRSPGRPPRVAFVFSGMGPQWWAMGRQLLAADAVFRRAIEACDALFQFTAGWSLIEQLTADSSRSRMNDAEVAQPANFALQVALAAVWRSWGIVPDAIVGHSAGEVAAACTAGILSLEDAVSVIYHRSRLQQQTTGQGGMLAVGLSSHQADAVIARFRGHVSVAAVNGPRSVTLSGDQHALAQIAQALHEMQVFAQVLDTGVPYHSHHMDALRPELIGSLAHLRLQASAIPFYSVVTGDRASGLELDASYWWANVRQPVNFMPAVQRMLEDGVDVFIEVSPHPVLGRSIVEIQNEREDASVPVLASLRRDTDERRTLLAAAAKLYTLGCRIDWDGVNGDGSYIPLPLYPWQRERFWAEPERSASHRLPQVTHPLLQRRLDSVHPSWEAHLDDHRLAYLRDHVIQSSVVFPTSAYIETALAANRELTGDTACVLEEVRFTRALILRDDDRLKMQFVVHPRENTFSVYSRPMSGDAWTLNATGRFMQDDVHAAPASRSRLESIQSRCRHRFSSERCYQALSAVGLQYGPTFRGIEQIWHGHREALGRIVPTEDLAADDGGGHLFHPAVLDACFQVISGAAVLQRDANGNGDTYLPVQIGRCRLRRAVAGRGLWAHAKLAVETQNSLRGDFVIFDDEGEVLAELTGFACQRVPNARAAGDSVNSYVHELQWYANTLSTVHRVRQSDYVPAVSTLAERLAAVNALERNGGKDHYETVDPQFDRLCAAYVWEALARLGWRPGSGERVDLTTLAQRLEVVASQRSHFARLLEILEEDGVLRRAAGDWVVADTSSIAESGTLRRAIAENHPAYEGDLVTLERCGAGLADVLRGVQDPRALIFPEGSVAELARTYSESPFFRIYNLFVRDCVSALAQALPKGRTIRVLEIGAGTGGTTAHVLPVLARNRTEYVFTDVSNVFTTAAKQRFADYPFIDYALLDIDKDPLTQGLAPHSFDIVIAVDVLHAVADLRRAIAHVSTLLSSGGLFVAMEITRAWRLFDIDFGPLRDWWRFTEPDPRSARFWLSQDAWVALLSESGFVDPAAVSDGLAASPGIHSVLLARGPHVDSDAAMETAVRSPAGTWIIFMDRSGVGERIALEIERSGDRVIRVFAGDAFARVSDRHFQVTPTSLDDLTAIFHAIGEQSTCRGFIHLWCLDTDDLAQSGDTALNEVVERGCVSALHLVHALGRTDIVGGARVWLVTRGAQHIGGEAEPPRPSHALLWGLGRVIMTEHPQLRATLLDLDPDGAPREDAHLVDELYAGDVEQEIAWRGDARYVLRVVPVGSASLHEGGDQRPTSDRTPPFQLEATRPGALESLRLREVERTPPGRNEVEIEIRAAGVNFRDVMKAMGMYLDRLGEAFRFGDECAGTIVRVGESVVDFSVGDEVIAVGPGCFGSFVTLSVDYVVQKPAEWTFEQAATIPVVFLTVHYALNHAARIKRGERVLIHSAAGGVGLAAVQVAQHAGAEIFATAGSPEKRAFLTSLGIPHVMDSRSLAFASEITSSTGGRHLDIVLNSLAGEFLVKSLALLRPTGRFVELGKVDFYENSKLGLAPFSRGLSFLGVDLGFLLECEPAFSKQLLAEVMTMFAEGTLRPLPVRTFPVSEASGAFRFIAQARHIGKVALSMTEEPSPVVQSPRSTALFREDATYLVTGGLRGFGLATAEWMVQQGARHLVLAGRSGASSAEVEAGIGRLRDAGAEVVAARADVSREDSVAGLLADIKRSMPPLRGVFHAAMVIDDGFLLQLDAGRLERVIAPKVRGAWHLHSHTLQEPLDFFVLFSSMASLVGTAGQGSYAAANAFLDALAHHRRALGLPGLSVNWGAIADVGYVARNPAVGRDLQRQGILAITPAEAGSILAMLLKTKRTQAGAVCLDMEHLSILRSSESTSRRFSPILTQSQQDSATRAGATPTALRTLLAASPPEARPHLVESTLRVELARVLGVRESQIDSEQPLADLGVDSLMSVELETVIRTAFGVDLPLGFLIGDKVSLRHLSRRLAEQSQTVAVPAPSGVLPADTPPLDALTGVAEAHS